MKKENCFTPEQMYDAEQLLDELEKVPESKRAFIVAIVSAYMNGIEAGAAYAQGPVKKEPCTDSEGRGNRGDRTKSGGRKRYCPEIGRDSDTSSGRLLLFEGVDSLSFTENGIDR